MEKGIATVVKHTGSHYLLSVLPEWAPFPAVIRGKLRLAGSKATNPVAVGDRVEFEGETITKILPRKNYLIRRSTNLSRESHIIAANLDRVFLLVTIILPETKLAFVDRFLVTCEAYGIRPVILVNKVDLYTEPELQEQLADFKALYRNAGYEVLEISARKGTGLAQVRALCREGLTLFSGASGESGEKNESQNERHEFFHDKHLLSPDRRKREEKVPGRFRLFGEKSFHMRSVSHAFDGERNAWKKPRLSTRFFLELLAGLEPATC